MNSAEVWISVVMPNYNKGKHAVEAVESVLGQEYPSFELIFVDDASSDGSVLEVEVRSRSDQRLILEKLSERSGGGAARNAGLAMARGRYVLFMDSDDWMAPGALGRAAAAVEHHPESDFTVFPMGFFDRIPGDSNRTTPSPNGEPDLLRFFRRESPWLISGPVWKRDFLGKVGGFDTALASQQDFDLHVRALIEGPDYHFAEAPPLVHYRQVVHSDPRHISQNLSSLKSRALMLRRHLDLLDKNGLRTSEKDRAIAAYLLDLAQMVRWHKDALGERSTQEGLRMWLIAHEYSLITPREYNRGMGYIRFKHNMLWNRVPALQKRFENTYRRQLGSLLEGPKPISTAVWTDTAD